MKIDATRRIEIKMQSVVHDVDSGRLSPVEAGARLTHLIFHPDFEEVESPRLRTVVEDLAPDLEIPDGDPLELWAAIRKLVDEELDIQSQSGSADGRANSPDARR